MTTTPDDNKPPEPPVGSQGWVDDGRLRTAAELEQLRPEQRAELARQRHQPSLIYLPSTPSSSNAFGPPHDV